MTGNKQAIVITFDRLPISFLGCYGHVNVKTPHFDNLASRSVVFDRHYAENIDSAAPRHAWATGCFHFPRRADQQLQLPTINDAFSQSSVETTLIAEQETDTPLPDCQQTIQVAGQQGLQAAAAETPFAKVVSQGIELLESHQSEGNSHRLLWLHSRGIPLPWSPPRQYARNVMARLRDLNAEEDDDEPLPDSPTTETETAVDRATDTNEPVEAEDDDSDIALEQLPDEVFDEYVDALVTAASDEFASAELSIEEWYVARAALGAYVELLDWSLGRLMAAIDKCTLQSEALVIVTAAQGMSAGERHMSTLPTLAIPEEIIHTPLLVQAPNVEPGTRRQDLVQTIDLAPTLIDWFQAETPNQSLCEGISLLPSATLKQSSQREAIYLGRSDSPAAIRTPDRYLIFDDSNDEAPEPVAQLYLKPDDVWEVNEVSAQHPAEVEALIAKLDDFISEKQFVANRQTPLPPGEGQP